MSPATAYLSQESRMPAPDAGLIESPLKGMVQAAGLQGEDAPALAKAVAETTARALTLLASMGMVQPGIPAALDPLSGSGSTAGPGRLMPPPVGGPIAAQLEGLFKAALAGQGLRGEDAPKLAQALAAGLAQAVQMFCTQTQVLPGIAVAGFVTASPGMLLPVPLQGPLLSFLQGQLQQQGLRGQMAPALAQAVAQGWDTAFNLFAAQMMVAPGIACAPGASASPGRLM
jgi:hypothetical protein